MALISDLNLDKIQIASTTSDNPIRTVKNLELSALKILATICSCRGTRFNTLQSNPLIIQTEAMNIVNISCLFLSVNVLVVY